MINSTSRVLLPGKLTSGATGVRGDSYSNGIKYAQAIARSGGITLTVAPLAVHLANVAALIASVDGVLIQGGGDIAPERYGDTRRSDTIYGIVDEHDEFELAVVRAAIANDIPLLAICRGLQILNVALGGTLHQDLGDVIADRERHWDTYHHVSLSPGSRIAEAMQTTAPSRCHSYHHQAIRTLGSDLVVTGRADDDVIEAIEHRSLRWVVGVQWHPEDDADEDSDQQKLFDSFVRACEMSH